MLAVRKPVRMTFKDSHIRPQLPSLFFQTPLKFAAGELTCRRLG